ncbi:MAG TPA: sigma-70 family RNA polymerase sigma factor [Thermoanaerobaculia bacterium]|jgi:RNA polymerase sigma-70 factor (ECF subfamily)|nr:sigma-70 family RNA polymerase sigma factor [Thermoanaerobaculia bacterium]
MAMKDDLGPGAGRETEELFRRYHKSVVSFFTRRGVPLEESRDLAQETFFRVFKHIDRFRGDSSVETWLFQVASNLYKNTLRSQATKKRDAQEVPLEEEQAADLVHDKAGGALHKMLTQEEAKKLREALEKLPPQMRIAVLLRVDGDLKYREIADVMHVSIETVKAHLYQARQHLRHHLADYFTDREF